MKVLLVGLALELALLSLAAFGGAAAIMPALHDVAVLRRHWMSESDFLQLYAVARVAPGPNILIASIIGWRVAGAAGLAVATAAILAPSSLVCMALSRLAVRYEDTSVVRALKAGLAPVAVGMTLASGYAIAHTANADWIGWGLTAAGAAWILWCKANPLWILLIGGGVTMGMTLAGLPVAGL
ncbi:chromate transporter [Phenylobacterium immobile]|uniref:chromate transporter n=1 Tax=Phenylobacterium immobile TaxID=21 RepID=UPI000AD16EE1|nr:chromate transporter [Phenylobacterium immobile]